MQKIKTMLYVMLAIVVVTSLTGCGGGGGGGEELGVHITQGWHYYRHLSETDREKTTRIINNDDGRIGEVINDSDTTSGELVLAFVFAPDEYDGGDTIVGHNMWRMRFAALDPYQSIGAVDETQDIVVPPRGDYYAYLVLAEYSVADRMYHIRGHMSFGRHRVVNEWVIERL